MYLYITVWIATILHSTPRSASSNANVNFSNFSSLKSRFINFQSHRSEPLTRNNSLGAISASRPEQNVKITKQEPSNQKASSEKITNALQHGQNTSNCKNRTENLTVTPCLCEEKTSTSKPKNGKSKRVNCKNHKK